MDTAAEVGELLGNLGRSNWAFSALASAVESGLLDCLSEPRTASYISNRTGIPLALAERLLDVLIGLGLVRRQGEVFAPEAGLSAYLQSPDGQYLSADLRATYLQTEDLIRSSKRKNAAMGWQFTDPDLLNAVGDVSGRGGAGIAGRMTAALEGLAERMRSPSASFLDVGIGVGALSIALCRHFPNLRVVGLDPQEAPLAEARRRIAEAALTGRIELRQQGVEALKDREEFDLAYFAQPFIPQNLLSQALSAIWTALRPGGWVLTATLGMPGAELDPAITRLRETLWGGGSRSPEEVANMMTQTGFQPVRMMSSQDRGIKAISAMSGVVLGRRPI